MTMTDAIVGRDDNPSGQIAIPGMGHKKLSEGEAGFRKGGGIQNLMCGNCRYFSDGTCSQVEVSPEPGDYCDEFGTPLNEGRTPSPTGALTVFSRPGHMDLFINRVAQDPQTGVRRWYATSSGTKKDAYGEYMTVGLFKDFILRAERREQPPEMFASRAWRGGLPYMGVAHYLDLEGVGIVGDCEQIYIDGEVLKAKGIWRDTPIALRAFDSIQKDIADNIPQERRVRISIAFVDWGHEHKGFGTFARKALTDACELCSKGVGEKFYRKGHLVHLALTRRPAYAETEIALEERSMTDKRADAASIVGDEMADELEKRAKASLTARSAEGIDPGAVVVRQETEAPPDGQGEEPVKPETPETPKEEPPVEASAGPVLAEESILGGAKSLDEAEAFLVRSGKPPLMDSWAVLGGVLANIAGQDKAPVIAGVLADFQRTIDVMTARALTEVSAFIKAGPPAPVTAPAPAPEPAKATATEVVTIQAHVLDPALATFRSVYDEAMATPVDANNRLSMIQPAMDALGDAIMRNVVETTAAGSPEAPAAPASVGLSREETAQLFAEQIAPIRAMVEQLTQAIQAPRLDTRSRVPAPRGLTVTQEAMPGQPIVSRSGSLATPASKPNSLRAISRRSVGLPD
jgi:hypothetical protein